MRLAVYGLFAVTLLVGIGWATSIDLWAQRQSREPLEERPVVPMRVPVAAAGDVIAFCSERADGPSQVTLIDAKSRTMCVYHIDASAESKIELKSVRNCRWDLRMEEFNGMSPLPREIRALMEQKK